MKKVVFRVDSGNHIGVGHSMRCLTLALELKKNNYEVHFITKNHAGFFFQPIAENFPLHVLEGGLKEGVYSNERDWIGGSLEDDLEATNAYLNSLETVDLFIVDHYSIDSSYEEKIQAKAIMVIDDLMNRTHFCDLLIDQNITADKEKYMKLMKKLSASFLIGPSFALLREEFKELRSHVDSTRFFRPIRNILVFFGGSDAEGNTLKLARSLDESIFKKYNFVFVLKSDHRDFEALTEIGNQHFEVKPFVVATEFGKLMNETDLFIGAAGTTSWERASLGVASALIAVAENQIGNCLGLQKVDCIYYLGRSEELAEESWKNFFTEIVSNEELWFRSRKNSFSLVDAAGVGKVVEKIKQVLKC